MQFRRSALWRFRGMCFAQLRNPDFFRVFILQHNFERYLTPVFQHRQPFWFFGPITLLALLPWSALLWPAGREGSPSLARKLLARFAGILLRLLGGLPGAVLQFFAVETSQLHSSRDSRPCLTLRRGVRATDLNFRRGAGEFGCRIAIGFTWVMHWCRRAAVWTHRLAESIRHEVVGCGDCDRCDHRLCGRPPPSLFLAVRRDTVFSRFLSLLAAVLVEFAGLAILPRHSIRTFQRGGTPN